ncbi:hypothetical protein TVAG_172920 [Trichomonas vaginalis G3]|uniref:Uncharacterized protein n=1 Tax=Trichomonas vaginalis (strain ATCC PRA-98 / G3) TaxID=412133 RepID=A2DF42_TRIV3|nr:VPS9 domain family [Trichomonas vaginalis G3]EAY21034.1 hypothetical protein TVAG_172920 [Trichomonas vaginalis G3]KAI5519210.1 VPS9 domain family [Trichomonas vaginalis G3]|eukprot:XP_001582020.1 hypothetical protein [Trichomonas vaginalis G3]
MSASPTDDYVQMVEELRELQVKLIKEDTFYEYLENETKETISKLEKISYRARCIQKYIITFLASTFRVKPSSYSLQYVNSLFTYDIGQKIPYKIADIDLDPFYKVGKACVQDFDILSNISVKLIDTHPEFVHNLCNSTIPALFQNLFTRKSIIEFNNFTKTLFAKFPLYVPRFLSFMLMHPLMSQFIESVIEEIQVPYTDENYIEKFIESWNNNYTLMPKLFIDILKNSSTPETLLFDLFVKPIFQFPKMHCLLHQLDEIDEKRLAQIITQLNTMQDKLWEAFSDSSELCDFPKEESNVQIQSISQFFVFSDEDLVILSYIAEIGKEMDLLDIDVPEIQPYKVIFIFPEPVEVPQASMSSIILYSSQPDDIEMNIRSLIVKCPPIIHASSLSQEKNFFFEIRKMLAFIPREEETSFELKIVKVEQMVKDRYTFRNILDILKNAFEKRSNEHIKSLSNIAQMNNKNKTLHVSIEELTEHLKNRMSVLRYYLLQSWSNDPQNEISLPEDVIENPDTFSEFFTKSYGIWTEWLKNKQFFTWDDTMEFHEFLMRKIPLEKFVEKHQNLVEEDQKFVDLIDNKKDEIMEMIKDKFIKVFLNRPELLDEAELYCRQIFTEKSPLEASNKMHLMFRELIFVTESEVKDDAGENEYTPLRLLVFIRARPQNLFSKLTYMSHFLYSMMEDPLQVEVITICEALCGHFREIIDKFTEHPAEEQQEDQEPPSPTT